MLENLCVPIKNLILKKKCHLILWYDENPTSISVKSYYFVTSEKSKDNFLDIYIFYQISREIIWRRPYRWNLEKPFQTYTIHMYIAHRNENPFCYPTSDWFILAYRGILLLKQIERFRQRYYLFFGTIWIGLFLNLNFSLLCSITTLWERK